MSNKPELQKRLQEAFPELTDSHFDYHESDLYVIALPGVIEWLNANYEWSANMRTFIAQEGTDWARKLCLDIPFANFKK